MRCQYVPGPFSSSPQKGLGTRLTDYKIAVIGAGNLGIRIAGELALQGCTVHLYDQDSLKLQTVHSIISGQLHQLKDQGLLSQEHQLRGNVIVESILASAVSDADIVLEAVIEDVQVKTKLFKDIASLCSEETVLCSNTLTLQLKHIFTNIHKPERGLGLRFLYPVYLIDPVEVTIDDQTSDTTVTKTKSFLQSIRKSSFVRVPGGYPRKLTEQEAFDMQMINPMETCHIDIHIMEPSPCSLISTNS